MKRLAVIAFALAATFPVPAAAQDNPGDSVDVVVVYGNDTCPVSTDPTRIIVCPRMGEDERYRIPPNLRESDNPANDAWANKVERMETVGAFGTMSCSASGVNGWTGCTKQLIDQAYAEKHAAPGIKAAQLIQEEREKRLSTIDADAAAEQARVEVLEKEYDAKMAKEREAAVPGETPSSGAPQGSQ